MRILRRLIPWLIFAVLFTACQASLTNQDPYPQPPATQALATLMAQGVAVSNQTEYPAPIPGPLAAPSTIEASPPTGAYPQPQSTPGADTPATLLATRHYLAGRLGLEVRQVQLASWNEASWITPNLGCQVSAAFDAQNPTPGYRIMLNANRQEYEIHSDLEGEQVCLAEPLEAGERLPLARDTSQQEIAAQAQSHLGSRTGIPLEEITITSTESASWADNTLGCQLPPGKQPDQAFAREIPGFRIILSSAGISHEYHSGGFWLVYCGMIR